jgi:hypothetical protein
MSEYFVFGGKRFVQGFASSGALWRVLGDEELSRFNYQSRTLLPSWGFLKQTPSVFKFNAFPRMGADGIVKDVYRADISAFREDIFRVNNWTERVNHAAYLFSGGTALFNGDTYPLQQYLTMSFNVLEEMGIENGMLKFKTLTPDSDTSRLTPETHPQFVHKWDIVSAKKIDGKWITNHVETPHGKMWWFICSNEGFGYIPLEFVKKV